MNINEPVKTLVELLQTEGFSRFSIKRLSASPVTPEFEVEDLQNSEFKFTIGANAGNVFSNATWLTIEECHLILGEIEELFKKEKQKVAEEQRAKWVDFYVNGKERN